MIEFRGVDKRFGRWPVLRDLSVSIHAGRVTGLIGPNGVGKTTMLKLILGLTRPDAGEIAIAGRRLDGTPDYRDAIGYMPQMARFPRHVTGRELLTTLADLRNASKPADLALADDLGLGSDFDRPLGTLSGGTLQRINAVMAFAFVPEILILDEPTVGLDPVASRTLKEAILAARDRGATVLITSHVLPELESLVDDVVFLSQGAVQWHGPLCDLMLTTGQVTLEEAVIRLLLGDEVPVVA